ncbi:carbon-nitrogen hydrolase family protein [Larkinella ripae]
MKLGVAQTRPVKGDILRNIETHKKLIGRAVLQGADVLIFPELSITGYEPSLARNLATQPDDRRFDEFQTISDTDQITIGIGVPTPGETGTCITMVLFQPTQPRQTYSKQYLHADEEPYFVSGTGTVRALGPDGTIALAICYELSVPEHSAQAFRRGASVYLTSVAKTAGGVDKASQSLSDIARQYAMTVLMANSVGPSDDFVSAGKSAIWNTAGELVGQLNETDEGILLIDTHTQKIYQELL